VLLLVIDTQRADHLSGYGYPRPTAPVLEALAGEGVVFRRALSQSSWTLPSMISMFAGHPVADEVMTPPANVAWLPETFRLAGWKTAGFVSNDLMSPKEGFDRGFDTYLWPLPEHGSNAPILDWIRASSDRPAFTFVHLIEPHDPYDPPADLRRWANEGGAISPERLAWYDRISKELGLLDRDASLAEIERRIGEYDDEVRAADRRIGEIFDAYKAAGLWEDTVVLVAADHGEGLFTHVQLPVGTRKRSMDAGEPPTLRNTLLMTHGGHVDLELLHVPLILKAPGLAPRSVDGWVGNVDIGPTLLELAGIEVPPGVQGRSLVPLAQDPADRDALRECVVSTTRYMTSVVTQDSMQVVLPTPRGECDFGLAARLHDLARDPECRTDLSGDRPDLVERGRALSERVLADGIRGRSGPIGSEQARAIEKFGYAGGVVDQVREELARSPVDTLLDRIAAPGDCFVRAEAARALEGRELEPAQAERLRSILAREVSPEIRARIERALGL